MGNTIRSLYGAALSLNSRTATTALGEPKQQLRAFASQAQTALGHSEFIGTGGSLYYLHNTDLLRGSENVVVEVRDRISGRVETTVNLRCGGADYDLDGIAGARLLPDASAEPDRSRQCAEGIIIPIRRWMVSRTTCWWITNTFPLA